MNNVISQTNVAMVGNSVKRTRKYRTTLIILSLPYLYLYQNVAILIKIYRFNNKSVRMLKTYISHTGELK